jgi:hypothetical protein
MMKLCPKYVHVWPAKHPRDDEEVPFYSDIFPLLDDPKIFNQEAIHVNTPYKVSIRVLACQNVKDIEENYCEKLCECEADKRICELGTKYVYFYIDKSKKENAHPRPTVYLLAFTKGTRDMEMKSIVDEVKKIATEWLEITDSYIDCHIFVNSKRPPYGTDLIDTVKGSFRKHCNDPNYKCRGASSIQLKQMIHVSGGGSLFNFYKP